MLIGVILNLKIWTMYLLGLGLLVLWTWYLLKLYDKFKDDPIAKKEIDDAWEAAKKDAKGKNPFEKGRIKAAIEAYKSSMNRNESKIMRNQDQIK